MIRDLEAKLKAESRGPAGVLSARRQYGRSAAAEQSLRDLQAELRTSTVRLERKACAGAAAHRGDGLVYQSRIERGADA